jgi:hypothetical protein
MSSSWKIAKREFIYKKIHCDGKGHLLSCCWSDLLAIGSLEIVCEADILPFFFKPLNGFLK